MGGVASKRQRCNGGTANEVLPISEAQETQEKPEREASLLRERGRTGDASRGVPARRVRAHSALGRSDVRGARLQSVAPGRSVTGRGVAARSGPLSRRCALPRGAPREVERTVEQARRRASLRRRGAGVCAKVGAALFL